MNVNHALIDAFERSKAEHAKRPSTRVFTAVLLGLFFTMLLAVLAMGAHVYGNVAAAKARADDVHLQAGYLANIVRMNDAAAAARRAEGPEGPALVLAEELESGTYETRIYLSGGKVVQEYAIAGRPFDPANATPLFDSSTFDFELRENLLSLHVGAGTVDVALRSGSGSARLPQAETPEDETPGNENAAHATEAPAAQSNAAPGAGTGRGEGSS